MIIKESVSGSVTFRNGTAVNLNDSSIISAKTKKQCCPDGRFEIGGVYAATLSLTCKIPGTNSFNLRGAEIILNSRYGSEQSFSPRGTFWITDARRIASDIYSITALDAVGWLDASSMNYSDENDRIFDNIAKMLESTGEGHELHTWCGILTNITNSILQRITGTENMLEWIHYDSTVNGDYRNQWIFAFINERWTKTDRNAVFFLSTETGSGNSDCPRDLFRYLAQLAGGFICARPDGKLTLRQFAQYDLGTVDILPENTEADSLEIADFAMHILSVTAQSEIMNAQGNPADFMMWTEFSSYAALAPFRIQLSSNPFLDGFTAAWIRGDAAANIPDLGTIAINLWMTSRNPGSNIDLIIRPFRCKVHMQTRFEPGQHVRILDPRGDNFLETVLTSVTWTFRGGYELSCAGEDSRTMSDALRMSKADKALKEVRNRCSVLEKKLSD